MRLFQFIVASLIVIAGLVGGLLLVTAGFVIFLIRRLFGRPAAMRNWISRSSRGKEIFRSGEALRTSSDASLRWAERRNAAKGPSLRSSWAIRRTTPNVST